MVATVPIIEAQKDSYNTTSDCNFLSSKIEEQLFASPNAMCYTKKLQLKQNLEKYALQVGLKYLSTEKTGSRNAY